jgi:putative salt-induced outer membrane protein YdiY
MKTTSSLALIMLALAVMTQNANAAKTRLYLLNGDRMTGEITGTDENGDIILETAFGQIMTIPRSAVKAMDAQANTVASPADDTQTPYTYTAALPSDLVLTPPPAQPQESIPPHLIEPAAGDVAAEPEEKIKWSGRVNAGANLQDGNTDKRSLSFDGEAQAKAGKNRYIAGGEAGYAEDSGEETENDWTLYAEYERFLSEKWFAGGRVRFHADELQNLDLRSKYGVFAGYQIFDTDSLSMKARTGVDYIREEFETAPAEEDIAASWAFDYTQKFFDDNLTLFHNHGLSVPFEDTGAFLFESKTGLRVPIAEKLTGTAEIDFDWDNDPAPGIKEGDTAYTLKIGYAW